jgi:Predicted metal-dependent hydrolase of the TIM-barrel fold
MKANSGSLSVIDAHAHVGVDLLFYLRGYAPYGLGWSELCEAGDASRVDKFVVFPMPTHLGLRAEALREGRIETGGAWEQVPYAFENRRMAAEIARHPGAARALPFWMFDPAREPERQCAALRALHEEFPCAGLKVQATIIQSPISGLLGTGACLLDLAEEKNWPVLIHTSVHPSDPWSPVADILRIVESRPGIRFNLAHSCRFDRPSLDRIAELPNAWFDCSAHAIHCELAVQDRPAVAAKDRRFESDYRDPVRVLGDLAAAYPDKLLWGSDAPFHSYSDDNLSLMSSYAREVEILRALGPEVVARIASSNTLAYLG